MLRLAPLVLVIISVYRVSAAPPSDSSNQISGGRAWSRGPVQVLSDQHRHKQASSSSSTRPSNSEQLRDAKEMKRRRRNKVASEPVVKFDDDDDENHLLGPSQTRQKSGKRPHQLEIDQLLAEKYQPQVLATLVDSQFGGEKSVAALFLDNPNNNSNLAAYDDRQVTRQESTAHRKEGLFSTDGHKQQEHERFWRNQVKEDDGDFGLSTPATTRAANSAPGLGSANSANLTAAADAAAAAKPPKRRKPQQQRHNSQHVVVSGANKGAGAVEKPPPAAAADDDGDGQVLLAKDVSVRSDLLFVKTSAGSSPASAGIDGLSVRNLTGSVQLAPAQAWTRRRGSPAAQLLEFADAPAPHRLIIDLGAANLQPVDEEAEGESLVAPLASVAVTLDEPAAELLREDHQETGERRFDAGQPSSASVRVSSGEPSPEALAKGLVINHRGLIVAAKRANGSVHRPPYNFSALYANHVDHSLSPINKSTHLHHQHHSSELGELIKHGQHQQPTHLPAFLHQRPPTVSSIIWRNTSGHHSNQARPSYHLIGGSVDGGPPYLVPGSKFNPMSIFTDLAVSEQSRDQPAAGTSTTTTSTSTTRRPVLVTEAPDYQLDGRVGANNRTSAAPAAANQTFHHNPPYKHQQSHQQPQLDLAATQQIVQAYDNKTLLLASMTRRKQQASSQHHNNKHHDRPANSVLTRPPANDHHQQATSAASVTTYDTTTPPFELNQTISSSLNAPLAAATTTNHHNLSFAGSIPSRPQSSNGKLMSKLQHMIIGKILKQQSSGGNMSSAGSSFVPTSLAQWPTTTAGSSPVQQAGGLATATNVTPPPLLSTTVANNVANLIAQKLSTLFTKPPAPPTSSHQPSGLGLSSLFGYRVGNHNGARPVKQRLNPLIQTAHSPLVNRRTAGMGSILVSGLIYGLSVLPALMALTGVNPLTGSGGKSQLDQIATSSSSTSFSIRPPRATSKRTTTTARPTTPGDSSKGDGTNKLQGGYAYLVPMMSAIANSLDEDDYFNSPDTHSAQQTALKQLYAPSPTVIDASDAIPVQLLDTSLQADSLVGLANHPLSFVPSLSAATNHHHQQPHHQHNHHHHYPYAASVYGKSHLHYSSPLVSPASASNHWQYTRSAHQDSWHNPVTTTTTTTSTTTTPHPDTYEHTTFRSVRHHKTKRRDLYSTGSSPHRQTSVANWRIASLEPANRAYRVGYTLNYKPVNVEPPPPPPPPQVSNRQQQFIEFQDVNDMDQLVDQWRPIQVPFASSRGGGGEAKYNLNQGLSRLLRGDATDHDSNQNSRTVVRVDEPSRGYNFSQSLSRLRSDAGDVYTRYVKQPTDDDDR